MAVAIFLINIWCSFCPLPCIFCAEEFQPIILICTQKSCFGIINTKAVKNVSPCPCCPVLSRPHCPTMPHPILSCPRSWSWHAPAAPCSLFIPSDPVPPADCPAPSRPRRSSRHVPPRPVHPALSRHALSRLVPSYPTRALVPSRHNPSGPAIAYPSPLRLALVGSGDCLFRCIPPRSTPSLVLSRPIL